MELNKHKLFGWRGLTLLEILIASMLMAVVMISLANVFIVGTQYVLHNRSRLAATQLGKYFLDPLQSQVRQDQWGQNCLSGADCTPETRQIDNRNYTASYTASSVPEIANLTKMSVNITWTE